MTGLDVYLDPADRKPKKWTPPSKPPEDDYLARLESCSPAEDGVCEAMECCKDHSLQRALEAERQRIIEKNAPEIERINAWIERDTALLRQALEMLTAEYVLTDRLNEVVEALEERLK